MRAPLLAVVAVALVTASCASGSGEVGIGTTAVTPPTTAAPATTPSGASPTTLPPATPTPTPASPTAPEPAPLAWSACGKFQCATLTVPLDYTDPSKGTIDLALKRRPASQPDQRIGSLLVNPGGPGVPGTALVDAAALHFSKTLLSRFDIVGWDPRGTGKSSPVDCIDNLDDYFAADPVPRTPAEKQEAIDSAEAFDAACESRSGRVLPYVSTQDSARDIDQIRRALGEDKISFFGFSYGSELGGMYATLFPTHVRAMVVDGASNPNVGYAEQLKEQVIGLERALQRMLDDCARKSSCAFHNNGDPTRAFDALMTKLNTNPLPGPEGRPPIGLGIAFYAVSSGLYLQQFWRSTTRALAAAQQGDGSQLLKLYDNYLQRNNDGTWSNEFEGLIAIRCVDDPGPTDPNYPDTLVAELTAVAPHFGPWMAYNYNCIDWPVPRKPPVAITGAGAGPIVVVGTTGDPVTPIESSTKMAGALEGGVLVTVEGDQHTGYGLNDCIIETVDDYLTDLTVPPAGVVCS